MAGQPGGGHWGCILPSKAISTEVHFDNLRVKRWTDSEALVSFPNTRTLIRDKLILAAFIFDFLSDYTEPLKCTQIEKNETGQRGVGATY